MSDNCKYMKQYLINRIRIQKFVGTYRQIVIDIDITIFL